MNRPEIEKPPLTEAPTNRKTISRPEDRFQRKSREERNPSESLCIYDNTYRGIRIPWERLISDKRSEEK